MNREQLIALFGLSAGATDADIKACIMKLHASRETSNLLLSSARTALGMEENTATAEVVSAAITKLSAKPEDLGKVSTKIAPDLLVAIGLSAKPDATTAEALEAVKLLSADNGEAVKANVEMMTRLAALETVNAQAVADNAFNLANEAGKILPASAKDMRALAALDPAAFTLAMASAPVVNPTKLGRVSENGVGDNDITTMSVEAKEAAKALGVPEAVYIAELKRKAEKEGV